jgi:hypothetical protein
MNVTGVCRISCQIESSIHTGQHNTKCVDIWALPEQNSNRRERSHLLIGGYWFRNAIPVEFKRRRELRYVFQKRKYRTLAISNIQKIINKILTLLAQGITFNVFRRFCPLISFVMNTLSYSFHCILRLCSLVLFFSLEYLNNLIAELFFYTLSAK